MLQHYVGYSARLVHILNLTVREYLLAYGQHITSLCGDTDVYKPATLLAS